MRSAVVLVLLLAVIFGALYFLFFQPTATKSARRCGARGRSGRKGTKTRRHGRYPRQATRRAGQVGQAKLTHDWETSASSESVWRTLSTSSAGRGRIGGRG